MRYRLFWLAVLAGSLSSGAVRATGDGGGEPVLLCTNTVRLIAGGDDPDTTMVVGQVISETYKVGWKYYVDVTYVLDDDLPCGFVQLDLDIVEDPDNFPTNRYNIPKVDEFAYHQSFEPDPRDPRKIWTFTHRLRSCNKVYIAAHATLCCVVETSGEIDVEFLEAVVDGEVVEYSLVDDRNGGGVGEPSYFDATITGSALYDGTYDSYCIDHDRQPAVGGGHLGKLISTYSPEAANYFDPGETPENLDRVNWLYNQHLVGTDAGGALGQFTALDMQRAIWRLLNDDEPQNDDFGDPPPLHIPRINQLVAAALSNGNGFIPQVGDEVLVLVIPVDADGNRVELQPFLIPIVVTGEFEEPVCVDEEAWGEGWFFTRRCGPENWAMYFASCTKSRCDCEREHDRDRDRCGKKKPHHGDHDRDRCKKTKKRGWGGKLFDCLKKQKKGGHDRRKYCKSKRRH